MDPHDKDAPLEPGWKRDKHGVPKKKFGTKVKEFFKGKKKLEKERLEREGKLHHDGDKPVEDKKVKEKIKDDGTHKVEEVKKIENTPADKANKIDETHKVEKEIKPDGTEKIKEKHDVDNGAKRAGNKVDEHHSFTAKQAGDGDKKIDETHKVDQHNNGGKFQENRQFKDDVDKYGQHHIDETHKIQGDNIPKHVDKEHYTTGGAGHQGQVGGPHMYGLPQGGAHQQAGGPMLIQENLSEQRPIQYTNSQAHGIHAGQQVPIAGTRHIAGIEGGQPGNMMPQHGMYQPQQFSTLPAQHGLHGERVMTHHLGDLIKTGGPMAAAAALQQSHHQMTQSGHIQQPGLIHQPIDAFQEIQRAQHTNHFAQNSTLHMPAPQFNLATNQAGLANMQRAVNHASGVPYNPPEQTHAAHHIQGYPEHMKDGDLLNRPLDAPPTTVFKGTGPAFDPNKAPVNEKELKAKKEVQHTQQVADQQKDFARHATEKDKQELVQTTPGGGKEKHVEKQEVKPDGHGGAVAKKESIHEQKGDAVLPDQKVKETEKVVKKADHLPSGTATKHAPVEETKEVQYMGRTPGHVETPREKK